MSRGAMAWLAVGAAGFAALPWHVLEAGLAPALLLGLLEGRWWLLPLLLPLALAVSGRPNALIAAGLCGLAWLLLQGFAVGLGQPGFGPGAAAYGLACLMLLARGIAGRGYFRGDAFTSGAVVLVVALIALFVFFPIARVLQSAAQDNDGAFAPALFAAKLFDDSVWGLGCIGGNVSCGVAWNTLFLALFVASGTTLLGLAMALVLARTAARFRGVLRVMTVLPIITPPFVIGLAIILLFGRSGAVSALLFDWFDIRPTRWIYGFTGIALAQLLAFTPIAFLVLIGVVQGISPSLEEAARTLRARDWATFRTVSLPLMRPGIANAFLLGFVESMADFGNPLVLGGNYEVLATKIFFAVVGAAHDQGRAAVLAIILLAFTLSAFYAQHRWLGRRAYTAFTGKGDAGLHAPLPRRVRWLCIGVAVPWSALTLAIYATILIGGFVQSMGRDYTLTLRHYLTGFAVETTPAGLHFTGAAWSSFFTTLEIAAISAPLTAGMGLLTAYLLTRQQFVGRRAFEFGTMLSFAIPGTVIGVSYILAFNVPPIELTGTGAILVICFVFRNMPVGVRAGMATMSQIDRSLDEASLTLGARSFTTVRRIILPLLRPAIVAALVYSFVRAMTAVSAVIFLVTAQYNMATAYIVGRVDAGEIGLAIAYSSVLIAIMLIAILSIQAAVGERRLGRRAAAAAVLQRA